MKKSLALLAIVVLTSCGKPKLKVHVTSPLTYEETRAYLQVYDEAKAEQAIFQAKIAAYSKVVNQLNKNHKYPDGSDFRVDDVNCPLIGDAPCDRTATHVDPQATVPPVKVDPAPQNKESPKK